jgi:predicted RNA-binding Zn-ribbon protein involved in translation (DUF1610 family)
MSLETKAQTRMDLLRVSGDTTEAMLGDKWVLLEDAQKEIGERDLIIKGLDDAKGGLLQLNNDLEAKIEVGDKAYLELSLKLANRETQIEAANKTIAKIRKKGVYCHGSCLEQISDALYIPRNDEQKLQSKDATAISKTRNCLKDLFENKIPVCPKCGALVSSESVRGQKKRYFCVKNCGWGSYKKPRKEEGEK